RPTLSKECETGCFLLPDCADYEISGLIVGHSLTRAQNHGIDTSRSHPLRSDCELSMSQQAQLIFLHISEALADICASLSSGDNEAQLKRYTAKRVGKAVLGRTDRCAP